MLLGAMAVPSGVPAPVPAPTAPVAHADAAPASADTGASEACLSRMVCGLKDRLRWRQAAWDEDFCARVAHAVLESSKRHDLSPALLLAVMIDESDLDEGAARVTEKDGHLYAKDSGLMGVRCVLDRQGRCRNGNVRGIAWRKVMDPLANIEIGANELAGWRTGGVIRKKVRLRDAQGHLYTKEKLVPCPHKDHAFWAHYNHGPIYIDHGPARHYPHRIAVLYYALARALNVDAPELARPERITVHDPGKRVRTPDRPVEPRFRKLCEQIRSVGSTCAKVAALPEGEHRNLVN